MRKEFVIKYRPWKKTRGIKLYADRVVEFLTDEKEFRNRVDLLESGFCFGNYDGVVIDEIASSYFP